MRATDAAGNLSGVLEHRDGDDAGGAGHAGADGAERGWRRRRSSSSQINLTLDGVDGQRRR